MSVYSFTFLLFTFAFRANSNVSIFPDVVYTFRYGPSLCSAGKACARYAKLFTSSLSSNSAYAILPRWSSNTLTAFPTDNNEYVVFCAARISVKSYSASSILTVKFPLFRAVLLTTPSASSLDM